MMSFEEWKVLAKGLKSIYARDNFMPDADAVKLWYQLLKDLSYQQVNMAIQKWMVTQKFAPTPAEIRAMASDVTDGAVPDWSEGWEKVMKALSKYGAWNVEAAVESFDELTKETVKRLGGFSGMCQMEYSEIDMLRANFRMVYTELARRKREENAMPMALKAEIAKSLEEGKAAAVLELVEKIVG